MPKRTVRLTCARLASSSSKTWSLPNDFLPRISCSKFGKLGERAYTSDVWKIAEHLVPRVKYGLGKQIAFSALQTTEVKYNSAPPKIAKTIMSKWALRPSPWLGHGKRGCRLRCFSEIASHRCTRKIIYSRTTGSTQASKFYTSTLLYL